MPGKVSNFPTMPDKGFVKDLLGIRSLISVAGRVSMNVSLRFGHSFPVSGIVFNDSGF
jgi:hypothetical protein